MECYFSIWCLEHWLHRNKVIFRDTIPPKLNKDGVIAKAAEFACLGMNGKVAMVKTTIKVKWILPPAQWFKLNSDGSSMGNPRHAGGGGIIRRRKNKKH